MKIGGKQYLLQQAKLKRFSYSRMMNRQQLEMTMQAGRTSGLNIFALESARSEEVSKLAVKLVINRLHAEVAAKLKKRLNIQA